MLEIFTKQSRFTQQDIVLEKIFEDVAKEFNRSKEDIRKVYLSAFDATREAITEGITDQKETFKSVRIYEFGRFILREKYFDKNKGKKKIVYNHIRTMVAKKAIENGTYNQEIVDSREFDEVERVRHESNMSKDMDELYKNRKKIRKNKNKK